MQYALNNSSHDEWLKISELMPMQSMQVGAEINEDITADYVERIKAGEALPSVTVFYDGTQYWLADGLHRYFAAKLARLERLRCQVRMGTIRESILFSIGASLEGQHKRTNAGKRRAVEILLDDPEWQKWSNSEIARRCCVSHTYVRKLREKRHEDRKTLSSKAPYRSKKRIAFRKGREYSMNISNMSDPGK